MDTRSTGQMEWANLSPEEKQKQLYLRQLHGTISTIFFLGIPTEIDGDEWEYKDCGIKFYNIPVQKLSYDHSEGKYVLMFDGEYNENVRNIMEKHCDDAKYVYLFTEYTYNELEVSVDYGSDFCCVHID